MSISSPNCMIPPNPDISGIGVRSAIYIQNLLGFVPAISALWDGQVAPYELEAVENESTTVLITAFGIIIAAMVQAETLSLALFHGNIILLLSWVNNTNTFIYLLLYVQHRSQFGPEQFRADLARWWRSVTCWFCGGFTPRALGQRNAVPGEPKDPEKSNENGRGRTLLGAIFRVEISGAAAVAILGSIHLAMMSALGIWLWSDPRSFGVIGDPRLASSCALDFSTYVILGKNVPLKAKGLRIVSLVIYSMFLLPGLNLLLPLAGFLSMVFLYRACRGPSRARNLHPAPGQGPHFFRPKRPAGPPLLQARYNPVLLPSIVGLVFLFIINLIFIVDIELIFRRNAPRRAPGDSAWSFGQILAVILLVLPLRELKVFGARRDYTTSLQNAIRWQATPDVLWNLVRKGANVNTQAEGCVHSTALLLTVSRWKDLELIRLLLAYGADPNIREETGETALHIAASHSDMAIVDLLLANGADPDIEGGEYQTALQAAAHSGSQEVVKALLEHGTDVNVQGGRYGTALQAASSAGHDNIVQLLRTREVKSNE
ncbi:ankyrin repeat-containing domain protein [Mycena crocata]|nr:ankyrin repeat-containing domain protein [Mycena crocata]